MNKELIKKYKAEFFCEPFIGELPSNLKRVK